MNDFVFYIGKNKSINNSLSDKFLKVSSFPEPKTVDNLIFNNSECVLISSNKQKIVKKDNYILLSNSRLDNLDEVKEKNPELSSLSAEEIFLELFITWQKLLKITGPFFSYYMLGHWYCLEKRFIWSRPLYCNNNDYFIVAKY